MVIFHDYKHNRHMVNILRKCTEGMKGSEPIPYDPAMVATCRIHPSTPTDCTAPRAAPCQPWTSVIMMCPWRFISVTNVPPCGMLITEEAVPVWGQGKVYGKSPYFSLHFPVNLKLL